MIQDIGPHRLYNQYERRTQPQPEDVVFAMENGKVLMKDSTSFPRVGELGMALPYVYLFAVDETRFFLLREPAQYPPEWEMVEVRSLRGNPNVEKHIIFAAIAFSRIFSNCSFILLPPMPIIGGYTCLWAAQKKKPIIPTLGTKGNPSAVPPAFRLYRRSFGCRHIR